MTRRQTVVSRPMPRGGRFSQWMAGLSAVAMVGSFFVFKNPQVGGTVAFLFVIPLCIAMAIPKMLNPDL
jgi:hypothetical protein